MKKEYSIRKICIVTTVSSTLDQFVMPSAYKFKSRGFEVFLIASMTAEFKDRYSSQFNLIDLPFERGVSFLGVFRGIYSLIKVMKKMNFTLVQYATPNASFYTSIASFFCRVPIRLYCQWGIRYVGFSGPSRVVFKLIEKITCWLSTDIRPASKKNMQFALEENLYSSHKCKVVGAGGAVGINLSHFNVEFKSKYINDILNEFPILKDKFVFGFVGRLEKDKGVNELLEAFKNFSDIHNNCVLLIVGPFDGNDRISLCNKNFMRNCSSIIFTGFRNDIQKLLSVMDVLVHPSYREGFSLVIQQAMAMKVPVITTDIPGPSEVIEEGKSGILVPAQNVESLVLAMDQLYNDSSLRNYFAKNGFLRVNELFIQEKMSSLILRDRLELIG